MGKICFYIIKHDIGFAPNPFHGVCTLAACTPNHMRAHLEPGDTIAGVFRSGEAPKLVYAMEVAEVLEWDSYYHDRRFRRKKPGQGHGWKAEAGDNLYFRGANGALRQDRNAVHHTDTAIQAQDIRGNCVFIGHRFIYFGENAEPLPKEFVHHLPGRGIKYLMEDSDPDAFRAFMTWRAKLGSGIHGLPRDRETIGRSRECRSLSGSHRLKAEG